MQNTDKPKGKLLVKVFRARSLKDVQTMGKQDPYVRISVDKNVLRTPVVEDGHTSPDWSRGGKDEDVASYEFHLTGTEKIFKVQVWNDNVVSDTIIGSMSLQVEDLDEWLGTHWHRLGRGSDSKTFAGEVLMYMSLDGHDVPLGAQQEEQANAAVAAASVPVQGGQVQGQPQAGQPPLPHAHSVPSYPPPPQGAVYQQPGVVYQQVPPPQGVVYQQRGSVVYQQPGVVYQQPAQVVYQQPAQVVYQQPAQVVYQQPGVVYQQPPPPQGVVYQHPPQPPYGQYPGAS